MKKHNVTVFKIVIFYLLLNKKPVKTMLYHIKCSEKCDISAQFKIFLIKSLDPILVHLF